MKWPRIKLISLLLIFMVFGNVGDCVLYADVIIDDGDSGTSSSGWWGVSGGSEPYGSGSMWARDGARYSWGFESEPEGVYEVLMWWSGWPSRASAIDVEISYGGGVDILEIDQSENAGQWNSLGTYFFDSNGNVEITAAYGSTVSTCADAVWFRYVSGNTAPVAYIDSILPNPADPCQVVAFVGHGEDSDGMIIDYNWTSDIDGYLSDADSFSTGSLSEGVHTIFLEVQDNNGLWSEPAESVLVVGDVPVETIIDNLDDDTSRFGTWSVSGGAEPYGENSFWSRDGSWFRWQFTPTQSGVYDVSLWWTEWSSRSTSIPVAIEHLEGVDTVYINQQQNGGQWNSVGEYSFAADATYTITITAQPGPTSTCADAVKIGLLETNMIPAAYIESILPNPADLGEEIAFIGYGTDDDGFISGYKWESSIYGELSSEPNFVISASTIGEGVHTIFFSVFDNNEAWSPVVTETLTVGNFQPVAVIDSISPNPAYVGGTVYFSGHGEDSDGTIELYSWTSSIDGNISDADTFSTSGLSVGEHVISFMVYDDDGQASLPVLRSLLIEEVPLEIIIDNRDSGADSWGTWSVSSGSNPYGVDSVWSRDGSQFWWEFTPASSGYHELYMWWTEWSSRSTSVPVEIEHLEGVDTVYINQQQNGGQWNSLGEYPFAADVNYTITITAQPGPASTCADAVRLMYKGDQGNVSPVAVIDSVIPNPPKPGEMVTFNGRGTDSDGIVVAYSWRSSIDGFLSSSATFSTSSLSIGTHQIYLRVQDDLGSWSPEVSVGVTVGTEDIYISFIYAGKNFNRYSFTSMLYSLGATQQNSSTWVYTDEARNMTYRIHLSSDMASYINALQIDGAHIILIGHSNYGLGPVFATSEENDNEMIYNIRYIDDDRILNLGTPRVHLSVDGMRTGQAYPYWWPIYEDGSSGIMPYEFGDPGGDPPYNYYLTYQMPGDANYYMVETVENSGIQRFFDSRVPAWYSADGSEPNANDPNEQMYFLTNSEPWSPSFELTGDWDQYQELPANDANAEYFKENYIYNQAGVGNDRAEWFFSIPEAGEYQISAWWPGVSTNAPDAPFWLTHAGGVYGTRLNQSINGRRWNEIGAFYFDVDDYSVLLTDDASSGNVVADGIRISHVNNPPEIISAEFRAWPTSGEAPLDVTFYNNSIGDQTGRIWDLGDGYTNTTRDYIDHTYNSPGIYTISLTALGPVGSDTKIKTDYIIVGSGSEPDEVLRSEFSAWSRVGDAPKTVYFSNNSTGDLRDGITYSPDPGFSGTDTFSYLVADDDGALSNEATVTVTVYSGNISPVANADSADTKPNTPVDIDVIANDVDLDGSIDPESVVITAGAGDGFVEVNDVDGLVSYTPGTGFLGTDSFGYIVADNNGVVSNEAFVEIFVGNRSPVAGDDSANTKPGAPVLVDVLANDSDSDGSIEPDSVIITLDPLAGIVEVNDLDGTVTYSPAAGFTGEDIFSYVVFDDEGAISNEAIVDVFIGNVLPVARDDSAETEDDLAVAIDILSNDSDEDGDIEPGSVLITSGPANGTVDVNDIDGSVVYSPDAGFTGTDVFMYTVADDEGGVSDDASVTINPANTFPIANDDSAYTKEPEEVTIDVLDNDRDYDGYADPGTIVVTAGPSNGSLVVHDTWLWDFGDGEQSHLERPNHTYDDVGNYDVTLTVTDAQGEVSSETKNNFVRVVVYEDSIDNVDYPKTHTSRKLVVETRGLEVPKANMKYTRMLYESCNSGNYFVEVYDRGIMYYTLTTSGGFGSVLYLQAYLEGKTDQEIWGIMQDYEPAYDYYNFNKLPSEQQGAVDSASMLMSSRAAVTAEPAASEYVLSSAEEQRIAQLASLGAGEVFDELKSTDFLINEEFLQQAVSLVFVDSPDEAVDIALDRIASADNLELSDYAADIYVSKNILEVFSSEAVPQLLAVYGDSDTATRCNLINAAGRLADNSSVNEMLLEALDDESFCENTHPESIGEPLRVCDLAYNQLSLYYNFRDTLRAISNMHSLEVRDYHIDVLKNKLM